MCKHMGFSKEGCPQIIYIILIICNKPAILGSPYSEKHSYLNHELTYWKKHPFFSSVFCPVSNGHPGIMNMSGESVRLIHSSRANISPGQWWLMLMVNDGCWPLWFTDMVPPNPPDRDRSTLTVLAGGTFEFTSDTVPLHCTQHVWDKCKNFLIQSMFH